MVDVVCCAAGTEVERSAVCAMSCAFLVRRPVASLVGGGGGIDEMDDDLMLAICDLDLDF